MGYSDESSNRWSFFSFILSIFGFFFFSYYYVGAVLGGFAILLSFLAEDYFKERSVFQYFALIVAVVDILGAIVGWNIVAR